MVILSFGLLSCGGGGGGSSSGANTGQFLDNFVEGLRYVTDSLEGFTDAQGRFRYLPGETVTFYIGDIEIGSAAGQALITPVELVDGATDTSNIQVVNILRFLQALDENGNPDDGIVISDFAFAQAESQSLDFSLAESLFEDQAESLLSVLTSGSVNTLVDISDAISHFEDSIDEFFGDTGVGVGEFGSVVIAGSDAATIGSSYSPTIAAFNFNDSVQTGAISWSDPLSNGFASSLTLSISSLIGNTVILVFADAQQNIYSYVLSCGGFTEINCAFTIDLENRIVEFSNATLQPSLSEEGNNATGNVQISGTLNFPPAESLP